MKIVRNQEKPWQDKEGYSKRVLVDEKDLNNPGSQVQTVKIKAGERAENHYHKVQTEVFYFLTDYGYWIINGQKFEFQIGDVLVIEPQDVHSVINESDQEYFYVVFKIKYDPQDFYWDK